MKSYRFVTNKTKCRDCDICFATIYTLKRHNLTKKHLKEMAAQQALKKARVSDPHTEGIAFVIKTLKDPRLNAYARFVSIGNSYFIQNDKEKTLEKCRDSVEDHHAKFAPLKVRVDLFYDSQEGHNKGFLKSLYNYVDDVEESSGSSSSIPTAGVIGHYERSEENMLELKAVLTEKLFAVDYELQRRTQEPAVEAAKYIIQNYADAPVILNAVASQDVDAF